MDKISRIGMFLEVVKHQSFAGAARHLGVTGPALSKQVQALESHLGIKLLHRTTRHIALTEEGRLYFDRARKALEDLQEAENQVQELKDQPTGSLKINAPMSFGKQYLTAPIATFAKTYPQVSLQVDFDDRQVDMIKEGYDVVIRIGHLKDSSLIARKLAECPIVLCASPDFLESHPITDPQALTQLPAVVYNPNGFLSEWRYSDLKNKVSSVALQTHFSANNAQMMLQACLQGVGIALLPIFTAFDYLDSGQLIEVFPAYHTHPARGIYIMYPDYEYLSTRKRLFIDWMIDWSHNLPWKISKPKGAAQ